MTKINPELYYEMTLNSGGDSWGWAMSWGFAIAETLYCAGEDVPDAWNFRPSPFLSDMSNEDRAVNEDSAYEDQAVAYLWINEYVTAEDLVYAGNVIVRYCNMLRSLGLGY